jgi:hypothetical protein
VGNGIGSIGSIGGGDMLDAVMLRKSTSVNNNKPEQPWGKLSSCLLHLRCGGQE